MDYDVVVVGGGINGAGAAQAAGARGYSVLVLEQSAVASGTSSRSSKLIHGGLRYLESMQYSLVRESLRERRLLLKLAPDLVRLVPVYIPIYRQTKRRPWQIRAGLSLYALLGGLGGDNLFSSLPAAEWDGLDGLDTRDLQAVFRYRDGQTNDALLTRAVMESARTLGADVVIPGRFIRAERHPDHVNYEYRDGGGTRSGKARTLINAAGPWVNQVLDRITPKTSGREIELVRGTHIQVAGTMKTGVYYLETPQDGRAVFVMPWEDSLLVGTTEVIHEGDPDNVSPSREEEEYLLTVLGHYFPRYRQAANRRVLSSYAGLRVLPAGSGRAFHRPRETTLAGDVESRPRVISVYGGKLTTYRATADKVMERLSGSLPPGRRRAETGRLSLSPS